MSNETNGGEDAAAGARRRLGSASQECAKASRTILELNDTEYNSCTNLEWQACAAMGRVPGQQTPRIVFATPPKEVDLRGGDGQPALGACTGHAPYGCGEVGYANDDIFFLETCLYSKICANHDELFRLDAGEMFTCQLHVEGVRELQKLLLAANVPGSDDGSSPEASTGLFGTLRAFFG